MVLKSLGKYAAVRCFNVFRKTGKIIPDFRKTLRRGPILCCFRHLSAKKGNDNREKRWGLKLKAIGLIDFFDRRGFTVKRELFPGSSVFWEYFSLQGAGVCIEFSLITEC